MLQFILNDGHEIMWHVNVSADYVWTPEPKPEIWQYQGADGHTPSPKVAGGPMREVVGVYADSHELEYVMRIFKGLPVMTPNHPRYGRGVTWRGDMARFIYDNL